jgi:hypothetical protein
MSRADDIEQPLSADPSNLSPTRLQYVIGKALLHYGESAAHFREMHRSKALKVSGSPALLSLQRAMAPESILQGLFGQISPPPFVCEPQMTA